MLMGTVKDLSKIQFFKHFQKPGTYDLHNKLCTENNKIELRNVKMVKVMKGSIMHILMQLQGQIYPRYRDMSSSS